MILDVLKELNSTLELPAVDGLGGLASVLEGDTEVGTAGAGRLGGLNLGRSVSDLINTTNPNGQPILYLKICAPRCWLVDKHSNRRASRSIASPAGGNEV